MELEHRFTVHTDVEETWRHFQDLAALAECFPGATVTSVEGDTFTGSAKVKLGPIALVYNGSGSVVERDEAAHRMLVEAKGKDKRGNGTAGATVRVSMSGAGTSTDVDVHTDLAITGKPAQFGRGVMQDVSDKLLGQFVACLEQRLGAPEEAAAPPAAAPSGEPATEPAAQEVAAPPLGSAPPPPPAAPPPPPPRADEALDLGATVLPVLVRTYWKQVLGAVVVLLVLRRLLRR
jgi:carbon monoxide dehydrogenase subunit G